LSVVVQSLAVIQQLYDVGLSPTTISKELSTHKLLNPYSGASIIALAYLYVLKQIK
jgi:hypothetical protein